MNENFFLMLIFLWIPGMFLLIFGGISRSKEKSLTSWVDATITEITFLYTGFGWRSRPRYYLDVTYTVDEIFYKETVELLPDDIADYKKGDPISLAYPPNQPKKVAYVSDRATQYGSACVFLGVLCWILPFFLYFYQG